MNEQVEKEWYELQEKYNDRWTKMLKEHLATKGKIEQNYRSSKQRNKEEEQELLRRIKDKKQITHMVFIKCMQAEFNNYHKRMAVFDEERQKAFNRFKEEHAKEFAEIETN